MTELLLLTASARTVAYAVCTVASFTFAAFVAVAVSTVTLLFYNKVFHNLLLVWVLLPNNVFYL